MELEDTRLKFIQENREYDEKMKLLSNCCAYIRYAFTTHKGIAYDRIESYANFYMYRWCHVRRNGLDKTVEYLFDRMCRTRKKHEPKAANDL